MSIHFQLKFILESYDPWINFVDSTEMYEFCIFRQIKLALSIASIFLRQIYIFLFKTENCTISFFPRIYNNLPFYFLRFDSIFRWLCSRSCLNAVNLWNHQRHSWTFLKEFSDGVEAASTTRVPYDRHVKYLFYISASVYLLYWSETWLYQIQYMSYLFFLPAFTSKNWIIYLC